MQIVRSGPRQQYIFLISLLHIFCLFLLLHPSTLAHVTKFEIRLQNDRNCIGWGAKVYTRSLTKVKIGLQYRTRLRVSLRK